MRSRPNRSHHGPGLPDLRCTGGLEFDVRIEIWSDVICPFCYLGEEYLRRALADFEHRDEVQVQVRSFELDPRAARDPEPVLPQLARKYRTSEAEMERAQAELAAKAAEVGLTLDHTRMRSSSTFDAHRLIHLAAEHQLADEVRRALMTGYFAEGVVMSDHDAIATIAIEAGVPERRVRAVLGSDEFAAAVRADEQEAADLGVTGVPYFLFDDKYAVSGAQPIEFLGQVLDQVWAEREHVPS